MTKNNPVQEIRNPSLTLYAFHLRNDITKGPQEVEANAAHLWETFEQLAEPLHTPELKSLRNKLICYQDGNYEPAIEDEQLDSDLNLLHSGADNYFLDGSQLPKVMVDPYRINDTYAADLTVFYEDILPITHLKTLNPQGCLLPSNIQASIGQTLLLFAEPVGKVENYQALASECVDHLVQGTNLPQLIAEGRLYGSPIFEYDTGKEDPATKCHIWVWFGDAQTANIAHKATGTLLNLLCCRHKILYIYHQSRYCNQQARSLYAQLEQYIEKLPQLSGELTKRLKQLQEWRVLLPHLELQYARYWRDMEDDSTAIAANAENYRQLLRNLPQATGDDLEFLQKFLVRTETKFQRQIKVDMSFLAPGRELLHQLIPTIRDVVEIEQAAGNSQRVEAEKNLENTIKAVTVGLTTGTSTASATAISFGRIDKYVDKQPNLPLFPLFLIPVSILLSIGLGIAIGYFSYRKVKIHLDKSKKVLGSILN